VLVSVISWYPNKDDCESGLAAALEVDAAEIRSIN
jgi:hypothetical protein